MAEKEEVPDPGFGARSGTSFAASSVTKSAPPLAPGVVMVNDLLPAQLGVHPLDGTGTLRPYFPRTADSELRAALEAGRHAVFVAAQQASGALRSSFEVMREAYRGRRALLLPELAAASLDAETLDRLLPTIVDVVWAGDLARLVEQSPQVVDWYRARQERVAAPVLAVVASDNDRLIGSLGITDLQVVQYRDTLDEDERARARGLYGRDLSTVLELAAAIPVPAELPLAPFRADTTDGRLLTAADDDLGIRRDVEMLAKLIASTDVHPPLSIGLFGRWGSGKSFLMRQIRLKIAQLASDAQGKVADTRQPEGVGFHRAIVPVEFNAWQYVKGEGLWASLINRVFECIREFGERNPEYQASLAAMATQAEQVKAAQAKVDEARAKVEQTVTAGGEDRTVADLVGAHGDLVPEADAVAQALNTTKDQLPVSAVRDEVTRLRGSVSKLAEGWRLAERRRRWRAGLLLLGGLLVGLVLASAQFLPEVGRGVAAVLAWAATVLSVALTVLKPANALLEQATRLLGGHDDDRAEYLSAQQELAAANADLDRLRRGDVAQLYDFVNERYLAEEYRRALGMTPIIREDLRRLSDLARPSPTSGGIDRVVIFIDDLDRCEPADVVRILEAVNLLFGFEMFVVVVAVDSRWLLRSLDQELRAAFHDGEPGGPTPQNYLEKIIQIPFWLQPMRPDGFGRLVDRLSKPTPRTRRPSSVPGGGDGLLQGDDEQQPGGPEVPAQRTGTRDDDTSPPPPQQEDVTLELRPEERRFMQGFSGLMDTPRAAKRFLNTYQLLRVSVYDVDQFVDGEEYKQVQILLALMTGTTPLTDDMVHELADIAEPTLAAFLDARQSDAAWAEVSQACTGLPLDLLTKELVVDWLPRVARYSFHPLDR